MSIVLHNKIVHILNKESNTLVLTDYEAASNQEIDKMYIKLYNSVNKNDFTRKASFNNYNENLIRKYSEDIIYHPDTFVENSKEIAKLLFDEVSINQDMGSCSLAIALFSVKDEKRLGVFKLDFKKHLSSVVNDSSSGKVVDIIETSNSLSSSLKSNQAFIIGATGINDDYHIKVLDKDAEKNHLESSFINNFLDATKIENDDYKTREFKETVDNFISNYFYATPKEAEDARHLLNYTLRNKEEINPVQFMESLVKDEDKKEIINEILEEKNLDKDIIIDSKWTQKKTKTITKKLDNGIIVKGKYEDFSDPTKYSVTKNKDNTINIVLKNIKFIEE